MNLYDFILRVVTTGLFKVLTVMLVVGFVWCLIGEFGGRLRLLWPGRRGKGDSDVG